MSCLDNTDILRIVGGNSFQIAITVKARRVADGSEIEDFDLSASSPVLNLIHAGEKTRKYFVTQGNQAIISFDGSEGLGYYGMEMSGSYNSEAWRFCIEKVLQLVDTNAKANIPEWSVLVDDTYFIEGTISIYGGGGGGDTVQADWTETNPTSAAFILHKPDLSVYATKTEVASGLAGKQDTIVDLTSIRYGAAAGATAYQKPASGIPESDMSEGVQSALEKAEDAYQLPSNGIPSTDMSESVQAALEKANSAVQTETDPVFSNSPAAEISQADINNWNAKQPAIADLADIREGAAAGATAVQPDEMAQAIDGVEGDIADINAKIPTAASNLNQLADKAYVNSSIATNSATYRGSFNLITDLGMNVDATHAQIAGALATAIVTADNNDYAFVQIPDSASTPTVIAKIERYKHNGSGWVYEYDLNNSGFTAAQWAAINSGITSGLVGKLADLPNNSELAILLNGKQNVINDLSAIRSGASAGATAIQPADLTEALNDVEDEIAGLDESKQDTIEDLSTIRSGAADGATAYQKPVSGIPESDMSEGVQSALGKADSAYQKPASGIPASDMDSDVQASLEKANSAVQTETDPVFSNSPAAEISQNDINSWNAKQSAIADLADIREGAAAGATAVQPDEMAQAIDEVDGDIADINAKIPTDASNLNQLADKAYVNSSIATNSATYRGSFNLITDLGMNVDATHAQIAGALATAIATADNNDYAFVQIPDSASTPTVIAKIERYKHNGSGWVYEYDLNNSGFTSAQWAAINSGITSGLVGKLADLPNNSELATLLNGKQNVISDLASIRSGASAGATAVQPADLTEALNGVEAEIAGLDESKQDTIEDLATIRSGAAAGATAYQKPSSGIPESDMSEGVQTSLGKADSSYQKPSSGIPSTDMSEGVQAALEKANSAVQTETDPVFSNSPAAEISQNDINSWNAKQSAIADLADIREGAAAGATAVQPDEMAQAIDEVDGDIADINAKIPTDASNLNQLADKAYVNSSIATNSATYRGSFNLITDLGMNVDATHAQIAGALATAITTADNNDYAFVQIPDSASTPTVIAKIERYKHNGTGWVYEYDLNNSGFTSAQWAAINSGITSGLVGKLSDLPNNSELATLLNGKQNVINDLSTIRSGAAAGATAYQKPSSGIPASDMSSSVQQELSKANTAVQTETDPIFSASPAAGITAQNIQTWNGEPAARQAADTALQTAIQNEATARATADALLQQQYNALTQSDIIVGALPATGVPNVIYRVPGTTDFTDYMWYDNQFVPMATYGLPISAEYVVDNNLNKTQEEVNASVLFNSDVDEYPESNSTGVASSGGIASKLSPFYNVAYNQFSEYQTISGYYIDPNGVRRSSSAYQIRYIELTRTIDVKINLPALGNYCVCVSNTVPGINGSVDSILLYSSTTTTKTTEASTGQYKYLLWAQANSYTSDIVFKIESLGTPKEYLVSSDLNGINRSINYEKREELISRSLAVKSDLYAPIFVDWMQFSHAKSGISSIDVFDVVSATQDTITLSESDAAKFVISTPAIVVFPNNVYKMVYFSEASGNSIVKKYWQSIDLSSAVKVQSPFDTVRGGNGIHLSQYGYLALAQFTASEIVLSLSIRNKNFIAGVNFRYASISDGTIYENGNEIATYTCNFTQSAQNYVELYSGRININQGFGYSGQFLQSVCSANGNYVEINIPCHGKGFIEIQCGQMYIYADYRTAAYLYIDGELSETWTPAGAQTRYVFENKSVTESITVRFEATSATVLNRAAMALYSINFYESYPAATINSNTSIAVLGDSWTQFPALANALPEMQDYNSVVVRPDGTTGDGCGYLTKELARITGASVDNWGKGSMRADNWGLVKIDELLAHKRYDYVVVEFFINDFIAGHSTVQWLKDIYTLCQKIRIAGSTPVIVLPCMDNSDNTHDMYHESLKRGFDALSY